MPVIPEGLGPFKTWCDKHGLQFCYRKSGSLTPPKNREGGVVIFSTFSGASVVLKGVDKVSQEVFERLIDKVDPHCSRGWTVY